MHSVLCREEPIAETEHCDIESLALMTKQMLLKDLLGYCCSQVKVDWLLFDSHKINPFPYRLSQVLIFFIYEPNQAHPLTDSAQVLLKVQIRQLSWVTYELGAVAVAGGAVLRDLLGSEEEYEGLQARSSRGNVVRTVSSEAKPGSVFSPAATAADPQPAVDSSEAKISDTGNLTVGVCLRMT
ncbi:hypothetical protein MG293_012813 [Ovis ammon polii]|uniref:Uncharacterized protein n=1 Tax=Ovis ammon polii TaxID=230172 RepID=A0AAD4U2S3_OVIAM|nr:hypothetical protein MG293_012813 [Ovis ammon polii]